jgi:glycosyltransferase involved in cell wall biosynthesis
MIKSFATFIMTYERAAILKGTIDLILAQTLPPQKILVVDNSESVQTKELIESLKNPIIDYYRVGYNSGPAGAARIGLQRLAGEGFQWINWGDDDNPPHFPETFEELIDEGEKLRKKNIKIGAIGATGSRFNKHSGELLRLKEIELDGIVEVDVIPANKLIINADVVREGVLPDEKLFFGFEELDFSFQMSSKQFKLFCHGPQLKKHRALFNRQNGPLKQFGKETKYLLGRRYYSYRNFLFILLHKKHYYLTSMFLIAKWQIRTVASLKFGFNFFLLNERVFFKAIYHGLFGKLGKNSSVNKV